MGLWWLGCVAECTWGGAPAHRDGHPDLTVIGGRVPPDLGGRRQRRLGRRRHGVWPPTCTCARVCALLT